MNIWTQIKALASARAFSPKTTSGPDPTVKAVVKGKPQQSSRSTPRALVNPSLQAVVNPECLIKPRREEHTLEQLIELFKDCPALHVEHESRTTAESARIWTDPLQAAKKRFDLKRLLFEETGSSGPPPKAWARHVRAIPRAQDPQWLLWCDSTYPEGWVDPNPM